MRKTQSAGGVVLSPEGKVLVVNQKHKSWSLPKGHIESGEDVLEAAKREIDEESGVDELTLIKPLGEYTRFKLNLEGGDDTSEEKTITMFLFKTTQTELAPKDADNPEAKWVDRHNVTDLLTHPKDKAFYLGVLPELP